MARAKSTTGKTTRNSKAQPGIDTTTSGIPDGNVAPAAQAAPADVKAESIAPEIKTEKKMFEVRKPDTRKNVVPINVEDEIRRRAFELYQKREPGSGSAAEDWLTAEREVMQRYRQHSA